MRVEKVFITPLIQKDTYGTEVDVSEYVKIDGLSKIKRSIDSTDYSIGVFRFNDLKLKCENARGTFNENDSRSIFPFTRDKALVRVSALEIDPDTFEIVEEAQFDGIINDEATRQNITTDLTTLTALSRDSTFRTSRVAAGLIANGNTAKQAIILMLSQAEIEAILTIDESNIVPDLDFVIDTASALDNLEVKEALDLILVAASSVLVIRNNVVYVQGRGVETSSEVLELKGRGELSGNSNMFSVSSYNSGKQRQFNSVIVNKLVTRSNEDSVSEYGLRQAPFDFPMVNDTDTLGIIADRIVNEFGFPKIELKVRVPTSISKDFDLLDVVSVDAPWLKKPIQDKFFPIVGVATLGDIATPLPTIQGSVQIDKNIKFKIISIEDDPKLFRTNLKLRQVGRTSNDGFFIPSIFGSAIFGESVFVE